MGEQLKVNLALAIKALGVLISSYSAVLPIFFWLTTTTVWAGPPLAGKIILTQGEVFIRRAGAPQWEKAHINQELFEGDAVKTAAAAQAAIICMDETQIRMNENTILVMKFVSPSPSLRPGEPVPAAPQTSTYQVLQGEIWVRNKRKKFRFDLEHPGATATIRGTEINVKVSPDGTTRITLMEGNVCIANPLGELCLRPGEEGFVIPGQAPTKKVLVQPTDAVQWSLYYQGIFSFRDLPLTPQPGVRRSPAGPPAQASLVREGEAAYDQGRVEGARQTGTALLKQAPGHDRALTLLGWVSLQQHAPQEALGYFSQVRAVDEMAIIGQALSRYRLGDLTGAYEIMEQTRKLPPNPMLVGMTGYFALLAGRVDQARNVLEQLCRQFPDALLPRAVLTQIYLVQNRKEAAQAEVAALSRFPDSPLALLTIALVKMASFDLPGATKYLEQAIAKDPGFVHAYVYLAKIWLGSEYLARARKTIERAMLLAPGDSSVLSLAGFVYLAYRGYEEARKLWEQAIKANPRLGEPHLGLAIYHFRHRRFDQGLEEMLNATLLEPRISLYQSELGKALYQTRSFGRALEVFDYAKTLDPQDPTPHLYKGIALSDLNRPGEAIQEINRSIALNNNTAIFRTKLTLDRDLAVRNYSLARAFDQLGMEEWAASKGITAVKNDPYNASAHLFLAKSYAKIPGRLNAVSNESLLFRLLSSANQNTFSNILNDNYTSMFEMPYARVLAQGGIGSWSDRHAIQEHYLAVYGGRPGLGFWVQGDYGDDRGMRLKNSDVRFTSPTVFLKWDPTVNGSLLGTFQYLNYRYGDISDPNDYGYKNNPNFRASGSLAFYELGYVHRFNPKATLITYCNYQNSPAEFKGDGLRREQSWEFANFQAQQNLVLGNHNLIAGVDYFKGRYTYDFYFQNALIDSLGPPEQSFSFYFLDYWRIHPKLLMELGLMKDLVRNSRAGERNTITNSLWSPLFGLNWYPTSRHTFRLALQRHLANHTAWYAGSLLPSETAGFTWNFPVYNGTEVRDAGLSWEAQWDPKTFSVLRLSAQRFAYRDFLQGEQFRVGRKNYQAAFTVNRIVFNCLGLSPGIWVKRSVSEYLGDGFLEFRGFMRLTFLHQTGWQGGITTSLVSQQLQNRADNFFGLVDLRFGKEFSKKRGLAMLEVTNLFNRHFYHALEGLRYGDETNPDYYPCRRIMFKLAFYF
jgi:tetratricopeptide (TPR) repeat protein